MKDLPGGEAAGYPPDFANFENVGCGAVVRKLVKRARNTWLRGAVWGWFSETLPV